MSKSLKLAFFATMSAGKTTCINALLGTELLHSANEATTATITTVSYGDKHHVIAYDKYSSLINEVPYVNKDYIKALNQNRDVKNINIKSNFNINQHLTIVDTPGPNNSRNNHHAELSYKYLENHDADYVIYLINATQPFIQDDLTYLKYISNRIERDKVIFIVNKMDELDFELESVQDFFVHLKEYLSNIGFKYPIIFAMSAYHALVLKKLAKNEHLTRKEKRILIQLIEDDGEDQFLKYLNLSKKIMLKVEERNYFEFLGEDFEEKEILNRIYCKTGLPYFEECIEQSIQKLSMKG